MAVSRVVLEEDLELVAESSVSNLTLFSERGGDRVSFSSDDAPGEECIGCNFRAEVLMRFWALAALFCRIRRC